MSTNDGSELNKGLKRAESALSKFPSHYNCAQSVLRAFASDFGVSEDDAVKYAMGFGSGIATGQMCGACTGAVMAVGLYTAGIEERIERKNKTYGLVREFLKRFEEKNGSTDCEALLGYNVMNPEVLKNIPEEKLPKFACRKFVESSILILSEVLDEDKKSNLRN